MELLKIFLSYCSKDNDLADIFEQSLRESIYCDQLKISRFTRDVMYRNSFVEFMDTLQEHDFVVTIISDAYLKSRACMYEVTKLLQESRKKFFYIVINKYDEDYYSQIPTLCVTAADIYSDSGVLSYITYWENEQKILGEGMDKLPSGKAQVELAERYREITKILTQDIGPLIKYLNQHKSLGFLKLDQENFMPLFQEMVTQCQPVEEKSDISLSNAFNELTNAFKPIYNPSSMVKESFQVDGLPDSMTIKGDKIYFKNKWFAREEIKLMVREDGPDAWGASIALKAGVWFRWTSKDSWRKVKTKDIIWFESIGTRMEVIEVDGEELHWFVYTTYSF